MCHDDVSMASYALRWWDENLALHTQLDRVGLTQVKSWIERTRTVAIGAAKIYSLSSCLSFSAVWLEAKLERHLKTLLVVGKTEENASESSKSGHKAGGPGSRGKRQPSHRIIATTCKELLQEQQGDFKGFGKTIMESTNTRMDELTKDIQEIKIRQNKERWTNWKI